LALKFNTMPILRNLGSAMRYTFSIFFLLILFQAKSQLALVNESGRFSNVREFPDLKSKVADTLHGGSIVFAFEDQVQNDWFPVDYKKNGQMLSGYIHRSQLKFLNGLKSFKRAQQNDSVLVLKLNSYELRLNRKKFIEKGKSLTYSNASGEAEYIKYIDGKTPWGIDGNLPRNEYQAIQFKSGKRVIAFPVSLYADLYEPSLEYTHAWQDKKTNKIFLEAMNGDGAGGYVVVWVIDKGKIKSREMFIPF
jgi:hypothetical protein